MTGYKARVFDQVGRPDRSRTEAQMRDRHGPRFLRVVDEVALHVEVRLFADDLDRILVGADRAVRTQPEEDRAYDVVRLDVEFGVVLQRAMRDIVDDPDGKTTARPFRLELIEHRLDHGRRELLARQTVAAGDDARHGEGQLLEIFGLTQRRDHIEIERVADGPRLFAAVEDGDGADALRQRSDEVLHGKWPVEADGKDPDLLPFRDQVFDCFTRRLDAGAHEDDDPLRRGISEVVEETVLAACAPFEVRHGICHVAGAGVVERVRGLAGLEEGVGILRAAAKHRPVRGQRPVAMLPDQILGEECAEVIIRQHIDLGHLV